MSNNTKKNKNKGKKVFGIFRLIYDLRQKYFFQRNTKKRTETIFFINAKKHRETTHHYKKRHTFLKRGHFFPPCVEKIVFVVKKCSHTIYKKAHIRDTVTYVRNAGFTHVRKLTYHKKKTDTFFFMLTSTKNNDNKHTYNRLYMKKTLTNVKKP